MSIVRIGLGEHKDYAEGYDAIFGKKKDAPPKDAKPESAATTKDKETEPKTSETK